MPGDTPGTADPPGRSAASRAARAARARASGAVPKPGSDLRETYRRQVLQGIGGWTGTVIAAIPTVVFVIVNAATTLRWAIVAAVATGVLLAIYRFARKQPIQQALGGLFAVAVAAIIAARTGQARGYFLFGILTSFAYAAVLAASVLVRRPLVGVLWEFLEPYEDGAVGARTWHKRRRLLLAYSVATLGGVVIFAARGVVQLTLFQQNATGWLAFAKIVMGYPLYISAVGFGFWIVTRARKQMAAADAALDASAAGDDLAADDPADATAGDGPAGATRESDPGQDGR